MEPTLSEADAAAIDAFFDVRASVHEQASPPSITSHGARGSRAAALLNLLEPAGVERDRALVDVVMLRMTRQAERDATDPSLCPADRDTTDALALNGYDAARLPGSLRERGQRHAGLAGLLRESEVSATPLLVEKTMQAVSVRHSESPADFALPRAGWRLADLVSVAAVLLIGASVLWPTLSFANRESHRYACLSGLQGVAAGFGQYAGDFRNAMPVATAGFSGPWWNVRRDRPQSNSANLFTLARSKYTSLDALACAGNPLRESGPVPDGAWDWHSLESVSYSYQVLDGRTSADFARPSKFVVLADRSPVVLRAVRSQVIDPLENSPNHPGRDGGRGQHALMADGSVSWMSTPVREDGDNIWLPKDLEVLLQRLEQMHRDGRGRGTELRGTELPADRNDNLLGP